MGFWPSVNIESYDNVLMHVAYINIPTYLFIPIMLYRYLKWRHVGLYNRYTTT